jgi:hypothetical protein
VRIKLSVFVRRVKLTLFLRRRVKLSVFLKRCGRTETCYLDRCGVLNCDRSRDAHCCSPPPQTRTCGVTASGSSLGSKGKPLAASPMRLIASFTIFRCCARLMGRSIAFPLVIPLPSIRSALASGTSLFADFVGTMGLYDCPFSFIVGVRLLTSRHGPPLSQATADHGLSRFPRSMFPHMRGVFDRVEPMTNSPFRSSQCCLRSSGDGLGAPFLAPFAALYPTRAFPCQRLAHGFTSISP